MHHRRQYRDLYAEGSYEPLAATGTRAGHVYAFTRRAGEGEIIVAVPRLVYQLAGGRELLPLGAAVWSDTALALPPSDKPASFRNVLTGERLTVPPRQSERGLPLPSLFQSLPLALLERVD